MKTIKSVSKNKREIKLVQFNGIYFILVNDNCVDSSIQYNYINDLFEKWSTGL